MNREIIFSYVKLYQQILERHQIFLEEKDLDSIYRLILLVFELDDLYDRIEQYPPGKDKLASIKKAMISLMPGRNPIGLQAIALTFQGMQDESLLEKKTLTLKQYLKVASKSIGASVIMAYLVSKLQLQPNIWYSNFIISYNNKINVLIRLANDLLDTDIDRQRSTEETTQIKAVDFFTKRSSLKRYLFYKYLVHKLHYYFYLIKYRYLKLSVHWQDYWLAIACSESVLDWAFQVYVRDRNSCQ